MNNPVQILKQQGFTLIELLITVAVFSVLASTIIFLINPPEQLAKANDLRRKNDLTQIQKALEVYYQDHGQYPVNNTAYEIETYSWGDEWDQYMTKLPKDPSNGKKYAYQSSSEDNYQSYKLYTSLDRGDKDPQAIEVCPPERECGPALDACGESPCNFGVSSPNVTP